MTMKIDHDSADAARLAVIEKASQIDFERASKEEYAAWINGLSLDEFLALMSMVDEHKRDGTVWVKAGGDDGWVPYAGDGNSPLPDDCQCRVLFADGEAGPNRADAFLWGDVGQARILAYQVVPALS